jgi:hypothetical protein
MWLFSQDNNKNWIKFISPVATKKIKQKKQVKISNIDQPNVKHH